MADVFISYAREDRALADELAQFLQSKGIEVWWDEHILGSDDFYEVILAALTRAKAAIVIWTKASIKSRFVRDEARFALHNDKLVATKVSGVDVIEIPFGFQSQHTDDVLDREKILLALSKLGAKSKSLAAPPAAQSSAAIDDWNAVRHSSNPEDVLDYLAKHPGSPKRAECLARLRELTVAPVASQQQSQVKAPGRDSAARAFFSGFSFKLPEFQSLSAGTYAATGGAVFYALIAALVPAVVMSTMRPQPYGYWTLGTLTTLVTLLGLQRFWAWRKQRNFTAAFITALAASAIAGLAAISLAVIVTGSDSGLVWLWPTASIALLLVLSISLYRAR